MVEIWLPYGTTETFVSVNDENLLGILRPRDQEGMEDPEKELGNSLESPLASEPLAKTAVPDRKVCLLVELVNPSTQSSMAVAYVLQKLNGMGIPNDDIKVLLTTETSESIRTGEKDSNSWRDTFTKYPVMEHDPSSSKCTEVGKTSKGVKVLLNKSFVEADMRILFSDVSLHRLFGYRGGYSAILPGIAGIDTIRHTHSMLVNPNVRIGRLEGNPVYESMEEASRLAKVDFAVCVLTNLKGNIVRAYAGDLTEAFHAASKEYNEVCTASFSRNSEIVIASAGGSPHDRDLYHATAGLEAALGVVRDGGAVILVAECPEGYGSKAFYEWSRNFRELKEVEREIKRRYVIGCEGTYCLLKAREKARVYLVSVMPDYYASNIFNLRTARTTNSALQAAQRTLGKDAKITVIPHALMILPRREERLIIDGT